MGVMGSRHGGKRGGIMRCYRGRGERARVKAGIANESRERGSPVLTLNGGGARPSVIREVSLSHCAIFCFEVGRRCRVGGI
jgi:hypothetical protein